MAFNSYKINNSNSNSNNNFTFFDCHLHCSFLQRLFSKSKWKCKVITVFVKGTKINLFNTCGIHTFTKYTLNSRIIMDV